MVATQRPNDPLLAEAWDIYESRLRSRLEPQENGKFLMLNVDTGEYELDTDDLEVSRRARARFGGARQILLRVGSFAAYQMGASGPRTP